MNENDLPVQRGIAPVLAVAQVVAGGMAAASVAGIVGREAAYPAHELVRSFVPNDVVNLAVALPFLLVSVWRARRGSLAGLLCLPGALLYVVYNYLVYALALPMGKTWAACVALAAVSLWAGIALVDRIEKGTVKERMTGRAPDRTAGAILAALGLLFFLRSLDVTLQMAAGNAAVSGPERAVAYADLAIAPMWIASGILLARRSGTGYVLGLSLLAQASMLFLGLVGFLILQRAFFGGRETVIDVLVVAGMSLLVLLPFVLMLKGAHEAGKPDAK